MIFSELIADVQKVIQDDDWTSDAIEGLLNLAQAIVATGVILPGKYQLSPPLPDLYTTGTVDTVVDATMCNLPGDFSRDLVQVVNSSSEEIPIAPSLRKFLRDYPQKDAGSVRTVARHGNKLLYRDQPSEAETLTVHYYRAPTDMTDDDDEPDGIPLQVHRSLLVGHVCSKIFSQIEDGIEGQMVNTARWERVFQQGLVDLGIIVGHDADPDYYNCDEAERIG